MMKGFKMRAAPRLMIAINRFARDEDGALIVFALIFLTLMIWMGGFALDVMRYEATRTNLQNTLDRATLAAASLNQRLDPTAVVNDYFAKAGMTDQLNSVTVSPAAGSGIANFRQVTATGIADSKPLFLHLLGIDSLDAIAGSVAEQHISNVEIALVLDISGSMSGAKIANLKVAAAEFVQNVLANDSQHRISIAIVPYNAQVNLGPVLRAKYNAVNQHGVADVNCVELPLTSFNALSLSRALPLPMMAYADIAYGTDTTNGYVSPLNANYAVPNYSSAFCKPTTINIVRLPSQDIPTLQAQINGLQAGGNTSIMMGMKWGTVMLDPSTRPIYSALISSHAMADTLEGRPFDYADVAAGTAMKVIVLMTDGEHVAHNRVNDDYKTGASPIYRSNGDGQYSIFHAARAEANKFWVPHLALWQATAWNSGAGFAQQDWKDIWANLKLSYVAWQFYGRALGTDGPSRTTAYNNAFNTMQSNYASVASMNAQLQQTCGLARAQGVIVYGIAFEAPANGQNQISQCAGSGSRYFATYGPAIQTVFRTIASNITQLRLTQ